MNENEEKNCNCMEEKLRIAGHYATIHTSKRQFNSYFK